MSFTALAVIALLLAALPAGLFLANLWIYRPIDDLRFTIYEPDVPPDVNRKSNIVNALSVLIPARNEESNIRATVEAVLANRGCLFEIIVLDDHSTDQTAAIVSELAQRDPRVQLATAPPLPPGWCGKPHACHVLAQLARHPLLVFLDADVRLAPDALERMAGFMNQERLVNRQSPIANPPALASGVPRQELGTFSERLLIPQIHFILLGFLPMHFMRRTQSPAYSAGCGQLFIARRDAYEKTGGHALICQTLHDGVKLPRLFRRAGFRTDLFDATDLATCRMYHTNAETWRGLGKNATEGLAAPGVILPMTFLLLGGQVMPFVLLALAARLLPMGLVCAGLAAALAYLPRLLAVRRFRQPLGSALLQPLGVSALLLIQWLALVRQCAGKPSVWKGRSYRPTAAVQPVKTA
jgi:hypothetical protein